MNNIGKILFGEIYPLNHRSPEDPLHMVQGKGVALGIEVGQDHIFVLLAVRKQPFIIKVHRYPLCGT